jgi:hypothetical protein
METLLDPEHHHPPHSHGEQSDHQQRIPLRLKLGFAEERVIEVVVGNSVTAILEIIAIEQGCQVEELILLRDGEDEAISAVTVVDADFPHRRRHHIHHQGEVKVLIYYQSEARERSFKRRTTLEDVLIWAIQAFGVDQSMAGEFELARHDQKEELPTSEHVGHLAGRCDELALDLVRGDIANGFGP